MSNYSSMKDHEQQSNDPYLYGEPSSCATDCCCLRLLHFKLSRAHEVDHIRSLLQDSEDHSDSWLFRKIKILKDFPELIAGPKWKNLVRKIGVQCSSKKSKTQFQYDAQSYALNFDDGVVEEDEGLSNFSSRFAVPAMIQQQSSNGLS